VDDGIGVFAGVNRSLRMSEVRDFWSRTERATYAILQQAVFETLAGLRVLSGSRLHLHIVPVGASRSALIAATESTGIWPLGELVDRASAGTTVERWLDMWVATFGSLPSMALADDEIAAIEPGLGIAVVGSCVDEEIVNAHVASREGLLRSLDAISSGQLGRAETDLSLDLIALSLLRLWSRWLGHFADSSVPYILSQFIRRPGRIQVDTDGLIVGLEARPLDVVIEMAGYLDALPAIPWLGGRSLRFERIAEQ
jgi:hypothetical protein